MRLTPSLFAIVNTPLYSSNNRLSLCFFFAIVMPNSSRSNAGSCSGDTHSKSTLGLLLETAH